MIFQLKVEGIFSVISPFQLQLQLIEITLHPTKPKITSHLFPKFEESKPPNTNNNNMDIYTQRKLEQCTTNALQAAVNNY
jgi:hypothetical protein